MRVRPYAGLPWPLRWLARLLTVVLALGLVLAGVVVVIVRQSFPQVEGELKIAGLTGSVEVKRDRSGVPHLYADTAEDLFLAQGFVHAQDRFWEMDFRRHVTAGRLSEMFGAATLGNDKAIRTMGWRRIAEQELSMLSERTRRYLDSYAKGVNAWLAANPNASDRSLEYSVLKLQNSAYRPEPWSKLDSVAWLKAMAWDLRSNMEDEIDRALAAAKLPRERVDQLYPGYPFAKHQPIVTQGAIAQDRFDEKAEPRVKGVSALTGAAEAFDAVRSTMGTPEREGIGSNSWVVSGEHTVSGKPLLANDPHLSPAMPSVWYQAGLHCRKKSEACMYDVTGFTFSGVPGVIIGQTDRFAWGFTNLGPDVADLYLEQVKDDTYLYKGEWAKLETRKEQIKVAGGAPVTITVRSTRHGPLVNEVMESVKPTGEATAVALQWTALMPGRTVDAIFDLNQATDWHEFRAAAALFEVPSQNLIYADTEGRIGYQAPGRIPVREKGDGTWPVPGWTGEYEWKTAPIPYDQLPTVSDPSEGYIVTANNAVIDPGRYKPLLTKDWAYGYRSQRIAGLLEAEIKKGKLDAAAMSRIQQDTRNGFAETLVPALMNVNLAGPAVEARRMLKDWDGSQTLDSAPAAYFNAVWRHLLKGLFDDDLPEAARPAGGDRWYEVVGDLLERSDDPFWDDTTTKELTETRDGVLRQAMADAYQELADRLGADVRQWRWGELHTLTLTNASFGASGIAPIEMLFNRGPLSLPGGKDAVNATGWNAQRGYEVNAVPSMRMVADLSDLGKSQWINLTGASGHAFHDNYGDQSEVWAQGRLIPMRAPAAHTLTLRP
ncbi:penicillin acylase family protein [Nonomuraea typhae]|uniref:penicillin acylase family protein n=1 Tax=Nonomuraea typhae TaxID=2603600 RepID=UPI001FE75CB6|nr:penicillin acylase family protein [Nonomuraea typhae]